MVVGCLGYSTASVDNINNNYPGDSKAVCYLRNTPQPFRPRPSAVAVDRLRMNPAHFTHFFLFVFVLYCFVLIILQPGG